MLNDFIEEKCFETLRIGNILFLNLLVMETDTGNIMFFNLHELLYSSKSA